MNSFFFISLKTCHGYSLEAPQRGASNEYPQHMILWQYEKNIKFNVLKELWLGICMLDMFVNIISEGNTLSLP